MRNKIVRVIAGVKPSESALYESLGIMKLSDINKYLIARFMYKILCWYSFGSYSYFIL